MSNDDSMTEQEFTLDLVREASELLYNEHEATDTLNFARGAETDAKLAAAYALRAYRRARALRMALEDYFAAQAVAEKPVTEETH